MQLLAEMTLLQTQSLLASVNLAPPTLLFPTLEALVQSLKVLLAMKRMSGDPYLSVLTDLHVCFIISLSGYDIAFCITINYILPTYDVDQIKPRLQVCI